MDHERRDAGTGMEVRRPAAPVFKNCLFSIIQNMLYIY